MENCSDLQPSLMLEFRDELNQITQTALRIFPYEANEHVTVIRGYLQLIQLASSRPEIISRLRRALAVLADFAERERYMEFVDQVDSVIRRLQ